MGNQGRFQGNNRITGIQGCPYVCANVWHSLGLHLNLKQARGFFLRFVDAS